MVSLSKMEEGLLISGAPISAGNDLEIIYPFDQRKASAVLPFHVDISGIINECHLADRTGQHGSVGIFHVFQADERACGMTRPPSSRQRKKQK